jgi:hypothetical protein
LVEGDLQIFCDFGGDYIGIGEIATAARLLSIFVRAQRIVTRMVERGLWRGIRAQEGVPQLLCVHMKLHDADEFDRLPTD